MIYGKCTMVTIYKYLHFGVVGSNTLEVLRWMAMDSRLLTSIMLDTKTIHGYLLHKLHKVLYVADPAKKVKHVVVPGKQDIIEVDGINDVEDYNQYNEMNLFTDLPQKMRIIEASLKKDDKPWARKDGESRIVTA